MHSKKTMRSSKMKLKDFRNRYSYPVRRCPSFAIRDGHLTNFKHMRTGIWNVDKAQLKKEEEEREKCEQELASMDNKIKLLEESLDKTEENLSQTTTKLNDIENVIIIRPPGTLSNIWFRKKTKLIELYNLCQFRKVMLPINFLNLKPNWRKLNWSLKKLIGKKLILL